jgi:hypothetical protein
MKTKHKVALFVLILLAAAGSVASYEAYNGLYNIIPTAGHISRLNVEELRGSGATRLRISGYPMDSALVLRSITAKRDGPVITVSLHLALSGLAKPKSFWPFEYELTVPDSVNEVRFGRDAKTIWKRGSQQP